MRTTLGLLILRGKIYGGTKATSITDDNRRTNKNLKSLGLIIENEEYAKKILNDISYFRLIKAYSLGFKPKMGNMKKA